MITHIEVSNFKSFKDLDIDLDNFNVLIGANGAGKTNFINLFKFLHDISIVGLNEAISNQGGVKYLKNTNASFEEPFVLKIQSNEDLEINKIKFNSFEYILSLNFNDSQYKINHEEIIIKGSNYGFKIFKGNNFEIKGLNDNTINIEVIGNINLEEIIPKSTLDMTQIMINENSNLSLLETPLTNLPPYWSSIFKDLNFYDIDPKKSKELAKLNGKITLKEDGENLALFVNEIIENNKEKFLNLLKFLIPTIDNIIIDEFIAKNSIFFKVKEKFSDEDFPSWYISDGSNHIISIIVILYYIQSKTIFIEEIDRNIHPKLLSRLKLMIDDALKEKQIITTTHNGEFLKHLDLDNILLIRRDENGFSNITRPSENEDVKAFLDEEIGIDELFVDDLLW
ncbi:MAG: AAA family ATPase [Methanobrevibacter sp.]|jgi:predicted ATPase|nr:AAA family ATPase [Candidatus Methanoflexus mossambicus]